MKTQEEFELQVYSVPQWVKTPQDLQKFTAHIYYRLVQSEDMRKLMEKLLNEKDPKIGEDISREAYKIYDDYQFYYQNPTFDKLKYFADHSIDVEIK